MNNIKNTPKVRINPEKIPESVAKKLAITFLEGARKFYSNPDNVRKFEEWQKNK